MVGFCIGQGIFRPFNYSNIIGLFLTQVFSYFCVYFWNEPLYIYPINVAIFGGTSIIFTLVIIFIYADRKTLDFNFKEEKFWNSFGPFVQEGCKFTLSIYLEFIGLTVLVYLASLLHNKIDLGAYAEIDSFGGFIWIIGIGAGDVAKVTVGTYIGERRFNQAINSAHFYQLASFVIGAAFVPIIYLLRNLLASFLTEIPALHEELAFLMIFYSFMFIPGLMMGTLTSLMRLFGLAFH